MTWTVIVLDPAWEHPVVFFENMVELTDTKEREDHIMQYANPLCCFFFPLSVSVSATMFSKIQDQLAQQSAVIFSWRGIK